MRLLRVSESTAEILFTKDELVVLNNALNEVTHAIAIKEFSTRIGSPIDHVEMLLKSVSDALDAVEGKGSIS